MQTAEARPSKQGTGQEQRRCFRVERQFSAQRPPKELVRDLLRAHSGK